MRAIRILAVFVFLACGLSRVEGQTVIVPEMTYSDEATVLTPTSTATIDADSVFMAFTVGAPFPFLGLTKFQVVNLNTGAIELSPVPLPYGLRVASVALLQPDAVLVVVRDDTVLPGGGLNGVGNYLVVNPLTGEIVRGPVPFTSHGTGYYFRIAVVDPSTVLIAHRSQDGLKGQFTVVDPLSGTVKVPQTTFDPAIDTLDVVALASDRVVIAYDHPSAVNLPSSFLVVNPQTGTVITPPRNLPGSPTNLRLQKLSSTHVLVFYWTPAGEGQFLTADTTTGSTSAPTTYTTQADSDFSPLLLGEASVFVAYGRHSTADFAVHDVNGTALVPETSFNPEGPAYFVSAAASGCRVLISYQDVNDGQKAKFQVLDFSAVCTPPCPTEITTQIEIYRSPFAPFLTPALQLQLVLVRNTTPYPIQAPIAFVADDLQNAALFTTSYSRCLSPTPGPFVTLHGGTDRILYPNEITGTFLLFLKFGADPITYVPRLLNGIPSR
jgi:hypothetical protein